MKQRALGSSGLQVSAIGLGCSGMTGDYGVQDDAESVATMERAIDLGVTLFDSSDAYGAGRNEVLIGPVMRKHRDKVVIASKFGNIRGPNGERGGTNSKPDYVPVACEASLKRLGVDHIDLYYQHRLDPETPIEDTVGAMAKLVQEGKVRYIGLCEVGPDTIRRAHAVHPLTAIQMEYSLWTRDAENAILPVLRELGIGLVPYSPLGRGFLTGAFKTRDNLIDGDRRHDHPRFQEGNFKANLKLLEPIEKLAAEKGVTTSQVALAWVLAQGDDIVPIPGTKKRKWLEQNVAGVDVELTDEDLAVLENSFPTGAASGLRYPEFQLKKLGL